METKKKQKKKLTFKQKLKKSFRIDKLEQKGFVFGAVFAFFIAGLFLILFLVHFMSSPFFGQISNILDKPAFSIVANSWENDEVVKSLAYLCNFRNNSYEKVECVYDFVIKNKKYGLGSRDGELNNLVQPEEVFNGSVVCRDIAVFGKAVFNKMGFENKLEVIPNHIYNIVYYSNKTCEVDMTNEFLICTD